MDTSQIAALRVEYETVGLDIFDLAADPIDQFDAWFGAAVAAGVNQPNAFVLATAGADGSPSARAVLMKDIGPSGLVFYTNRTSRKGRELAENPRAAACFVWIDLHRQVRLEGPVHAVPEDVSDAYFASRPPGSRLAAAASPQSAVVESREVLDARWRDLAAKHPDGNVARPEAWGGYLIEPDAYEFWQGRPNRFHDRLRYRRQGGEWVVERLAP